MAHGDIKLRNVLIEQRDGKVNCILIDFGSSIIRGQERLPTLCVPWNAPELSKVSHNLGFDDILRADLFSLALLCVHVLLPLDSLRDAGLCFIRGQQRNDEWLDFIYKLEQAKNLNTADNSLASRILSVASQVDIPEEHKLIVESIVGSAILPSSADRAMPWDDIFSLLNDDLSIRC